MGIFAVREFLCSAGIGLTQRNNTLIEKQPDVRVHTRITIGKDHKEAEAKGFDGDREGRNRPIASRSWCTKAGVGKHLDPKVYLSS